MASDGELCRTCSKPRNNHPYRHPFNGFLTGPDEGFAPSEGSDAISDDASQAIPSSLPRVGIAASSDPVLRMALIRKGIITTEDLAEVVDELNTSGVSGYEPPLG